MNYSKIFSPSPAARPATATGASTIPQGDLRDGSIYIYDDHTVLAINVALATGRPLLVRGPSGCGKSTLARNVARQLNYRYYEQVVTSRTQARDLLWEVDLVRRLGDAHAQPPRNLDLKNYVVPGILWKAFEPATAGEPPPVPPASERPAVVLLDEIDKADPDVPNDLLVPLGSFQFIVEVSGQTVRAKHAPLVFLTTNDERELPPAFLRRCVELKLHPPRTRAELVRIGRAHFPTVSESTLQTIAQHLGFPESAAPDATERPDAVSTAEYLDTVLAYTTLATTGTVEGDLLLATLAKITVWKHGRPRPPGSTPD